MIANAVNDNAGRPYLELVAENDKELHRLNKLRDDLLERNVVPFAIGRFGLRFYLFVPPKTESS